MAMKFNFSDFFSRQKNIAVTDNGDYELNIQLKQLEKFPQKVVDICRQ